MGPSMTACNDTVYGFGDNTSGPIWKFSLAGNQPPWGAFQDYTNHPFGENLYSPVGVTSVVQTTWLWTVAKVAGPVCGYNLVNFMGFVTAALAMCGFIYWLTRNKWIALLAGYTVSFAPYFQYKVGGHPSYGYHALLIVLVWLFLKVAVERKRRDAILLGLTGAVSLYWDPYFIFMTAMILGPLTITWLLYERWNRSKKASKKAFLKSAAQFSQRIKLFGIAAVILAVSALPLGIVRFAMASQISSYVSGTRGDNLTDAINCGIYPWEYVLPADNNWFIGKYVAPSFSEKLQELRHQCNPSEYNVSIAFAVLLVVGIGLLIFAWEKFNRRKLFAKTSYDYRFIVIALVVMVTVAMLFALPAAVGNLKLPFFYLLQITDVWRIPARLFLVINVGLTAIFAIVLAYFAQHPYFKNKQARKRGLYILIAIGLMIAVQYQVFRPFSGSRATFSYSKDMSSIYYWLKDQQDIKYIAAYPMDKVGESEAISHYITEQRIHGKKLLNSTLPVSPQERLRFSIKDLTDPQTLPILRYLGVDALEIHGIPLNDLKKIPGISVIKYDDYKSPITGGYVAVATINPGPKQNYAVVLEEKFPLNGEIMKSAAKIEFETEQAAELQVKDVIPDNKKSTQNVCFAIKMADPKDSSTLTVSINDKAVEKLNVTGKYRTVTFAAKEGDSIKLTNSNTHNMRIDDIGCQ